MKLRALAGAEEFVELTFKDGSWERDGIPRSGCRVRTSALEEIVAREGRYHPDDLIRGLMEWLDVTDEPEPALNTLHMLLDHHYPTDGREEATCRFEDENGLARSFLVGPIDLRRELVTWQRDNVIFAVGLASPDHPGRIIIGAPCPLPLSAALRILAVAVEHMMEERFDSFAGAVRMSGSTGNFYAWERGELTTCHWPHGLGRRERQGRIYDCTDELYPLSMARWVAPNQIAMMVAIAAGYLSW